MKLIEPLYESAIVGGIKTACVDRQQLVDILCEIIENKERTVKPFCVSSTNGHSVSLYNKDKRTREIIDDVDLMHADGQSIIIFSKLFCVNKISERTATTDLFTDFGELSNTSLSHFLFGGEESLLNDCAQIISAKYSNFKVCGTHSGYFDEYQSMEIVKKINDARPDVLWVGLGKPKEQKFVHRFKHYLEVPVIITCGGCYNYVTGDYKRAPELLQKLGLEWLHRMLSEPRKLFLRYLLTNPHAIYCAMFKSK